MIWFTFLCIAYSQFFLIFLYCVSYLTVSSTSCLLVLEAANTASHSPTHQLTLSVVSSVEEILNIDVTTSTDFFFYIWTLDSCFKNNSFGHLFLKDKMEWFCMTKLPSKRTIKPGWRTKNSDVWWYWNITMVTKTWGSKNMGGGKG